MHRNRFDLSEMRVAFQKRAEDPVALGRIANFLVAAKCDRATLVRAMRPPGTRSHSFVSLCHECYTAHDRSNSDAIRSYLSYVPAPNSASARLKPSANDALSLSSSISSASLSKIASSWSM